jgi:prepilin-type processing-associated H-X9-DG protein
MFYDSSNLARNATDPVSSLVLGGRHSGKNNFTYADGHVKGILWGDSPGITDPKR